MVLTIDCRTFRSIIKCRFFQSPDPLCSGSIRAGSILTSVHQAYSGQGPCTFLMSLPRGRILLIRLQCHRVTVCLRAFVYTPAWFRTRWQCSNPELEAPCCALPLGATLGHSNRRHLAAYRGSRNPKAVLKSHQFVAYFRAFIGGTIGENINNF